YDNSVFHSLVSTVLPTYLIVFAISIVRARDREISISAHFCARNHDFQVSTHMLCQRNRKRERERESERSSMCNNLKVDGTEADEEFAQKRHILIYIIG